MELHSFWSKSCANSINYIGGNGSPLHFYTYNQRGQRAMTCCLQYVLRRIVCVKSRDCVFFLCNPGIARERWWRLICGCVCVCVAKTNGGNVTTFICPRQHWDVVFVMWPAGWGGGWRGECNTMLKWL